MQQPVPDAQALFRRAAIANRDQANEQKKKETEAGDEDASLWEVYVKCGRSISVPAL